ncbi:sulfatase-like hydrolase/transferase [Mucilaginibacter boryungensis]|uniref:Sulfatase-like hydrolase/transferase n=1 Tax=Mucilaginibacter boryungensis TaxID=768480 RepID=A0ABR9XK39_9SPHI|nr:sulfatase-like hydrolase/transferase [Mucilaginibacter boryungensis]MBE9667586.1 sulfatase-like hydrolase/transferase [Mucilaginibacter boryungensis]
MNYTCCILAITCLLASNRVNGQAKPATAKKPNIIFILTDDLGYGDVGVFFQNQRARDNNRSKPYTYTPNLDKMAAEGAVMLNSYTAAPVCAPSRSSILTGLSQGHARVRDNQFDKDLADNYTLGNVMQKAGYATAAIGKWGLQGDKRWSADGAKWPAHPLNRGFDYYYGYMRHNDGHEHYPKEGLYEKPKQVYENRTEVSKDLDKCYTGDLWTAAAKKWIVAHQQGKKGDQPFFMYLAYDTPHAVLELPTGPYPKGGGLNGGVQWLGKPGEMINTANGTIDSYRHPDYANATYDNDNDPNTPEIPWPDTYKRYATSTRRIDDEVGDLLKLLADLKIDDNTLVIFSSDNGPSIEAYLPKPNVPYAANFFGSSGPFDGIKRDVLEGGERMPVIARWPGHIATNKIVTTPSISYDWLPTFTDAAGLPAPVITDGVSMLPALTGNGTQRDGLIYAEYFEPNKSPNYKEFAPINRQKQRNQMQMIRIGDFVGLRYNIKSADDDFGIFNITTDTHQSANLAADGKMADLQQLMKERVLQVRRIDTSAKRTYDDAAVPANRISNTVNGINWKTFNGRYSWLPDVSTLKPVKTGQADMPGITSTPTGDIYLFEGYIKVPENGDYTFYLSAGDKAFMRLHEAILIDADYGYTPGTTRQSTIKLKAGLHAFKIYAYNPKGTFNLEWKGPPFNRQKIPASAYYY